MEALSTARALALGLRRIALGFVDAARVHWRPMSAAASAGKTADRRTLYAERPMAPFVPTGSDLKPDRQFSDLRSALSGFRGSAGRFERILPLIDADPRTIRFETRGIGVLSARPGGARGAIDVTTK